MHSLGGGKGDLDSSKSPSTAPGEVSLPHPRALNRQSKFSHQELAPALQNPVWQTTDEQQELLLTLSISSKQQAICWVPSEPLSMCQQLIPNLHAAKGYWAMPISKESSKLSSQ